VNHSDAYRLEALVELAASYPQPLTASEIARRRRIPAPFLGRLLAGLAREGLLVASRGPRGGVRLSHLPEDVRLATVLPETAGASRVGPAVRWLAGRLAAARREVLERTTLAGLLAVEREQRAGTDWQI